MSFPLQIATQDNVLAARVRNVLANGGTWTDVVSLTAASGTASNTVTSVGGSFSTTVLDNNFKSLSAKLNELITLVNNVNAQN
jgi:hypothetical protein